MNDKNNLKHNRYKNLTLGCMTWLLLSTQVIAASESAEAEEHEEGHIVLSAEQIKSSDIVLTKSSSGEIREVLPLYGKVVSNAEQIHAVMARFDGVIRNISKRIGDSVKKGETLFKVEANESLKTYSIRSAINGSVTERKVNPGEQTNGRTLMQVQDFSTLWVDISLFPKQINKVNIGQVVAIKSLDGSVTTEGKVIYISPNSDRLNQAVTARVLIDNAAGLWQPGNFINGEVLLTKVLVPLVVNNSALQIVEDKDIIFVRGEEGFEPRAIKLGRTDGKITEILAGLSAGEIYVSKNSFILKSEMGKEDAEHGH